MPMSSPHPTLGEVTSIWNIHIYICSRPKNVHPFSLAQLALMWEAAPCLGRAHKPSKTPKAPPDSLLEPSTMIYSVAKDSIKLYPRGEDLGVPTLIWTYINPLNSRFCGLLCPWWIKNVTITLINRHQNCNYQVLSLKPQVMISFLYQFLPFLFLSFPYIFS